MRRFIPRHKALCCIVFVVILGTGFLLWPLSIVGRLPVAGGAAVIWNEVKWPNGDDTDVTMAPVSYSLAAASQEALALEGILREYSCHRSLKTLWGDGSLSGNEGDGWLTIYADGGARYLISGGAGEIILNGRVYRVDYFGNQRSREMIAQIRRLLADCVPDEAKPQSEIT